MKRDYIIETYKFKGDTNYVQKKISNQIEELIENEDIFKLKLFCFSTTPNSMAKQILREECYHNFHVLHQTTSLKRIRNQIEALVSNGSAIDVYGRLWSKDKREMYSIMLGIF